MQKHHLVAFFLNFLMYLAPAGKKLRRTNETAQRSHQLHGM